MFGVRVNDPRARIRAVRALIAAEPASEPTTAVHPPDGPPAWLQRLCAAAVRALPASGVAVTLMAENGVRGLAAASGPHSADLEELQYTIGEGPSIEAYTSRRPVLAPEMSRDAMMRWPGYAPAAREQGVRAVFAFPLQVGAARLGVLGVYCQRPGSLAEGSLVQALSFAEVAVQTLLDGQAQAIRGHLDDGLDRALDSRVGLYQAQGMVMVDLRVSIGEAMARLRAHAYATGRPLHDVARDVVGGQLRLDRDGPPDH
jgi:hypothetical protein